MKKIFLLLILVCFTASSQNIKLDNDKYYVIYDTIVYSPVYAKYTIDFDNYNISYKRSSINLDTRLHRKKQATTFDFRNNNIFDRGHLVPVLDFDYDIDLLKKVNVYTNIFPQHKNLNRGVWRDLERYIHQKYVTEQNPIIVYTGIIQGFRLLGKLKIPLYCWKLIFVDGQYYAWKIPNANLVFNDFNDYQVDPSELLSIINLLGYENLN